MTDSEKGEELLLLDDGNGTNADVNPRKPNSVRVVAKRPPSNLIL